MIRLGTPALEALEVLAEAGGALVLLSDDWHERPIAMPERWRPACGRWTPTQTIRGPCWVAPDRGPGRRPAVLRIVSLEAVAELQHEGLALIRDRRAELTERGRRKIGAKGLSCHADASGGGEAGGVAPGAPDAS